MVGENDFSALSLAANAALDRGDLEQAAALDKLARKVNASLSKSRWRIPGSPGVAFTWEDAPSTLVGREHVVYPSGRFA